VRDVVVVDRDTKKPEVFRLAGPEYLAVAPDREGWITSECLGVRMRARTSQPPHLVVEDLADPGRRTEI
jgi:Uma2 family endonuclease